VSESWKARKMVPGKDTIATMALHYGTTPATLREVIRKAGAEVIRDDGLKLTFVLAKKTTVWSDGRVGVDLATTALTKAAISAVVQWKISLDEEAA
jgi:hypothetical protein